MSLKIGSFSLTVSIDCGSNFPLWGREVLSQEHGSSQPIKYRKIFDVAAVLRTLAISLSMTISVTGRSKWRARSAMYASTDLHDTGR